MKSVCTCGWKQLRGVRAKSVVYRLCVDYCLLVNCSSIASILMDPAVSMRHVAGLSCVTQRGDSALIALKISVKALHDPDGPPSDKVCAQLLEICNIFLSYIFHSWRLP